MAKSSYKSVKVLCDDGKVRSVRKHPSLQTAVMTIKNKGYSGKVIDGVFHVNDHCINGNPFKKPGISKISALKSKFQEKMDEPIRQGYTVSYHKGSDKYQISLYNSVTKRYDYFASGLGSHADAKKLAILALSAVELLK